MKLYKNKDYRSLSEEEEKMYRGIKESEKVRKLFGRINKFREYPKAARHFEHLFPNNYLDIVELEDAEKINNICRSYEDLLDTNPGERAMLNFINNNEYYLLIASLFKFYNFGHHEAYLFKEFNIGGYVVDYLLVGKGSGGYEFIFVELEDPSATSFLTNCHYAESYRKGLNQIRDWKGALNRNFSCLANEFRKATKPGEALPEEFIENDESRRHYVVIAGRRKHYEINTRRTYEIRRNETLASILHYDNLIQYTKNLIGENSF